MKIAEMKSLHADAGGRAFDYLKITTDDGLVGWSEYNQSFGGAGVTATIEQLAPHLIGKDPRAFDPEAKTRLVAAAEKIAAGLPGTLPELLALSDDEAANKIEVFKKVRGVSEKLGEEFTRTVLRLHPRLAPITVAVFPLKKNEPRLVEMARGLKRDLQVAGLRAVYDDTGAIGKLYRRQDEIGTPWCITVDVDSLTDGAVTIRDRDSMALERVPVEGVKQAIKDRLVAARRG